MGDRTGGLTAALTLVLGLVLVVHPAASTVDQGTDQEGSEAIELATNLTIPEGAHVAFGPGTRLIPDPDVSVDLRIVVDGHLTLEGTPRNPVLVEVPIVVNATGHLVLRSSLVQGIAQGAGCAVTLAGAGAWVSETTFLGNDRALCITRARSPANAGITLLPGPLAGLASSSSDGSSSPGWGVRVADALFESNRVAVQVGAEAPPVRLTRVTIEENEVGLETMGAPIHLDHVRFAGNAAWDIRMTSPGDVTATGSQFDPACVHIDGRSSHGCQRGSIGGVTWQTILLGSLWAVAFSVTELGRSLLVRVGVALRLYSRIPRDELLEHEIRDQLIDVLEAKPGLYLRQLARSVDVPYGQTVHHLEKLEQADLVVSVREGQHLRFYPVGTGEPIPKAWSTRERVLGVIERYPGVTQVEIARRLGISRQLVSYHVKKLRKAARVDTEDAKIGSRLFPR